MIAAPSGLESPVCLHFDSMFHQKLLSKIPLNARESTGDTPMGATRFDCSFLLFFPLTLEYCSGKKPKRIAHLRANVQYAM